MNQKSFRILSLMVMLFIPSLCNAMVKERCSIRLKSMNAKTPGSLAFGPEGKLYLTYREDAGGQSSAIWVHTFDSENCRELRKVKIAMPSIQLPNIFPGLESSSDGKLLLYLEYPRGGPTDDEIHLAVLDVNTLEALSKKNFPRVDGSLPGTIGFNFKGDLLLMSYPKKKTVEKQPITESVRFLWLDPKSLQTIKKEIAVTNPFVSLGYAFDENETIWFSRDKFITKSLVEYDPETKQFKREVSLDSPYGFGKFVALPKGALFLTDENDKGTPFGRVVQFNDKAQKEVRFDGCGFQQVKTSPDAQYVAGLCEARSQFEYNFGNRVVSKLVVLDTKTLTTVGVIPLSTKSGWHEFAIGRRAETLLCAVHEEAGQVVLYQW